MRAKPKSSAAATMPFLFPVLCRGVVFCFGHVSFLFRDSIV